MEGRESRAGGERGKVDAGSLTERAGVALRSLGRYGGRECGIQLCLVVKSVCVCDGFFCFLSGKCLRICTEMAALSPEGGFGPRCRVL